MASALLAVSSVMPGIEAILAVLEASCVAFVCVSDFFVISNKISYCFMAFAMSSGGSSPFASGMGVRCTAMSLR